MANDSSPCPDAPLPGSLHHPSGDHIPDMPDLRTGLRSCLQRQLPLASEHALAVVGFDADRTTQLAVGVTHPERAVLGFVLPERYAAIGVIAGSVVASHADRHHRHGSLALGVDRRGEIASILATDGTMVDTHHPQGWLVDACLRAVGRTTAPCSTSPLAFPAALWLDRLMVSILNAPAGWPMCWDHAVELSPVPHRRRSLDPVDLGGALAATTLPWADLRQATIAGRRRPVDLEPEDASWMDDGMFSRWCMGAFPDLASLRGDVEFLAPAEVAERVEITLRAAWRSFAGDGVG